MNKFDYVEMLLPQFATRPGVVIVMVYRCMQYLLGQEIVIWCKIPLLSGSFKQKISSALVKIYTKQKFLAMR